MCPYMCKLRTNERMQSRLFVRTYDNILSHNYTVYINSGDSRLSSTVEEKYLKSLLVYSELFFNKTIIERYLATKNKSITYTSSSDV